MEGRYLGTTISPPGQISRLLDRGFKPLSQLFPLSDCFSSSSSSSTPLTPSILLFFSFSFFYSDILLLLLSSCLSFLSIFSSYPILPLSSRRSYYLRVDCRAVPRTPRFPPLPFSLHVDLRSIWSIIVSLPLGGHTARQFGNYRYYPFTVISYTPLRRFPSSWLVDAAHEAITSSRAPDQPGRCFCSVLSMFR